MTSNKGCLDSPGPYHPVTSVSLFCSNNNSATLKLASTNNQQKNEAPRQSQQPQNPGFWSCFWRWSLLDWATNMMNSRYPENQRLDIQNNGLEKATSFLNMAIFGIYVQFLGCRWMIFRKTYFIDSLTSKKLWYRKWYPNFLSHMNILGE